MSRQAIPDADLLAVPPTPRFHDLSHHVTSLAFELREQRRYVLARGFGPPATRLTHRPPSSGPRRFDHAMALELLVQRLVANEPGDHAAQVHGHRSGMVGLDKLLLPAAALGACPAAPGASHSVLCSASSLRRWVNPTAADYHKREQVTGFSSSARHGMLRLLLLLAADDTSASARRSSRGKELGLAALRELTQASNLGTQAGVTHADGDASRHLFHPPSLRALFDPQSRPGDSGALDLAERVAVPGTAAQQGAGVARACSGGGGTGEDGAGLVLPVGVPEHGDRYVTRGCNVPVPLAGSLA